MYQCKKQNSEVDYDDLLLKVLEYTLHLLRLKLNDTDQKSLHSKRNERILFQRTLINPFLLKKSIKSLIELIKILLIGLH